MSFFSRILKFLNWSSSPKPEINLNLELYEQLKLFRLPLIAVILMLMLGSLGYVLIDNFSLIDGIYQAVMTFSTVGFTEVAPISTAGRLFTITFIFLGFMTFTFSIGLVIEVIKRGALIHILRERQMLHKIARLQNHFVICYHNSYTIQLSIQFRENHIPFVVIDPSEDIEDIAQKYNYTYFVKAQPHTQLAFLKSHLSSAKGLIALSSNIADNIALIASVRLYEKELNRKPFLIMANSDNNDDTIRLKKLGADSVVVPSILVAQRLSAVSVKPDMENLLEKFLYKKDSPLDIEEIIVPEFSWMRFKRLKETNLRNITHANVVGIYDMYGKFVPMPSGETLIGSNAKLLVIGSTDGIKLARKAINSRQKPDEFKHI